MKRFLLRSHPDFTSSAVRKESRLFRLFVKKSTKDSSLAIIVGKKVHAFSTGRNALKRKIRAALLLTLQKKTGQTIVCIAKPSTRDKTVQNMYEDISSILH